MRKYTIRAIILGLISLTVIAAIFTVTHLHNQYDSIIETMVPATCTEAGYIVTTDQETGTSTVTHLEAAGHTFGEWIPDQNKGKQVRTCSVCSFQEEIRIDTVSENTLPKLYLSGSMDGIGKKAKVVLNANFVSSENNFECYAITTLQGHSTFGYPKRNYTVRFYDDPESVRKHKLTFNNWLPEHKYILKANYYDLTQCRNLIGARLWSQMAACRDNLSPRIAALPCYGAVDGFPIEVYLNEEFFGLYTMNLHKDEDLYQMQEGERAAFLICNQETTDESLFRALPLFSEDYTSDWEIEFCGTNEEAWVQDRFNRFVTFVMTSSDQEFTQRLSDHLDVDAAIDYLIFIYALGLSNSGSKDLVMLNYGDVFIPSAYDMDEAFGLNSEMAAYLSPSDFLPTRSDGHWQSGTGSLLWDRLLNNFEDRFRARYAYLRSNILTEETITQMVHSLTDIIPESIYDLDMNLYPNRPMSDINMVNQITAFIAERFTALDSAIGGQLQ